MLIGRQGTGNFLSYTANQEKSQIQSDSLGMNTGKHSIILNSKWFLIVILVRQSNLMEEKEKKRK